MQVQRKRDNLLGSLHASLSKFSHPRMLHHLILLAKIDHDLYIFAFPLLIGFIDLSNLLPVTSLDIVRYCFFCLPILQSSYYNLHLLCELLNLRLNEKVTFEALMIAEARPPSLPTTMIRLHSPFLALLISASLALALPSPLSSYLPVVIWHGLGDSATSDGMVPFHPPLFFFSPLPPFS
jgi:hypothetical protein